MQNKFNIPSLSAKFLTYFCHLVIELLGTTINLPFALPFCILFLLLIQFYKKCKRFITLNNPFIEHCMSNANYAETLHL